MTQPYPHNPRWAAVHLRGDRGPVFERRHTDRPFWQPEWVLKKGAK